MKEDYLMSSMFQKFLDELHQFIHWESLILAILSKTSLIIFIIIVFIVIRKLIHHFFQLKIHDAFVNRTFKGNPQRAKTILTLCNNALNYALYFFLGYSILSILGVPVATLLAGAGIVSVALGLGVKDFIADVVNGFFIILEGQYEVGEYISVNNVAGTVVQIGIRTTILQGTSGNRYYIPNGDISIVNNLSRDNMRVMIELPITKDTDLRHFSEAVQHITQSIVQEYEHHLTAQPTIFGLTRSPHTNQLVPHFTYNVVFYVKNGEQYELNGVFYEIYLTRLQEKDIHVLS